jgi:hypothetical protein
VASNLYYDGVATHGPLHEARMARVFYRRTAVEYQKIAVLVAAVMRHENADTVIKQLQRLHDLMFPGDEKQREDRESQMREIMKSEGEKSYRIRRVYLGEKRARR